MKIVVDFTKSNDGTAAHIDLHSENGDPKEEDVIKAVWYAILPHQKWISHTKLTNGEAQDWARRIVRDIKAFLQSQKQALPKGWKDNA